MMFTRILIKSKEFNFCINDKKAFLAYFQIQVFFSKYCKLCEIKTKISRSRVFILVF